MSTASASTRPTLIFWTRTHTSAAAPMLASTVFFVGTRREDSSSTTAAGISADQCRRISRPNTSHRSAVCPACPADRPIAP